jgi:enoyl-CoA hydratase/carnithine racemase
VRRADRGALELNLTGDPISAAEAFEIGLVNRVVPDHELHDVVMAWARKLGGQAPLAVGAIKRTTAGDADLDEGIAAELQAFGDVFATADAREGIGAFLGKRQAAWKGE